MKKKGLNTILLSILGLLLVSQLYVYSQTTNTNRMTSQRVTTGEVSSANDFKQTLRNLFEEHALLLNQAIVSAANNAPQNIIEAGKQNLFNNSRQLANLISTKTSPQSGHQFETLFNEHIRLGSEYINAVKANNQALAQQVANQALSNGRMIAQFFSRLYPATPARTWQEMLDHHVEIEAEQTKAYFKKDLQQATALKNESVVQIKELADLIANNAEQR